ncbi:MAG: hypothetical protein AMJ61_07355 [Desulfobacterales bacterium SG8_35_2]|nr:MAG: hypothetical protein AMJ61_07355 [Desulfobacterales bacterium SG8_35_2]
MDHTPSALIFPETAPANPGLAKLLIFFAELSYYQAVEPGSVKSGTNNTIINMCRGYTPAPLGDDLSRFNRLLREMETSRPDELSRLFSAAMAPMSPGQGRDQEETSAANVFSAMHKDAAMKTSIRYKERLWQARLILKLAEMLDRREAEVRQGLARISSVEKKVLASLEGLGEAETADLKELSSLNKLQYSKVEDNLPDGSLLETSGMLMPLRVQAWAELYLADPQDPPPTILATANAESGAILLDASETLLHRYPEKLFSLSIPDLSIADFAGGWDQYLSTRNTFKEAAQKNIAAFARFLRETADLPEQATDNRKTTTLLAENVSVWEKVVKVHYPSKERGFKKLDFYCLPGISFTQLFQRLFHIQGPVSSHKRQNPTAVLAILNI